eukprot:355039-Chlamydomonas_euryale.AAC.9
MKVHEAQSNRALQLALGVGLRIGHGVHSKSAAFSWASVFHLCVLEIWKGEYLCWNAELGSPTLNHVSGPQVFAVPLQYSTAMLPDEMFKLTFLLQKA